MSTSTDGQAMPARNTEADPKDLSARIKNLEFRARRVGARYSDTPVADMIPGIGSLQPMKKKPAQPAGGVYSLLVGRRIDARPLPTRPDAATGNLDPEQLDAEIATAQQQFQALSAARQLLADRGEIDALRAEVHELRQTTGRLADQAATAGDGTASPSAPLSRLGNEDVRLTITRGADGLLRAAVAKDHGVEFVVERGPDQRITGLRVKQRAGRNRSE